MYSSVFALFFVRFHLNIILVYFICIPIFLFTTKGKGVWETRLYLCNEEWNLSIVIPVSVNYLCFVNKLHTSEVDSLNDRPYLAFHFLLIVWDDKLWEHVSSYDIIQGPVMAVYGVDSAMFVNVSRRDEISNQPLDELTSFYCNYLRKEKNSLVMNCRSEIRIFVIVSGPCSSASSYPRSVFISWPSCLKWLCCNDFDWFHCDNLSVKLDSYFDAFPLEVSPRNNCSHSFEVLKPKLKSVLLETRSVQMTKFWENIFFEEEFSRLTKTALRWKTRRNGLSEFWKLLQFLMYFLFPKCVFG